MTNPIPTSPLFWHCKCPDNFVHFTDDDSCSSCSCTETTAESAGVEEIVERYPYVPRSQIPMRMAQGIVFEGSSTVHPYSDTEACMAVEDAFFRIRAMIRDHEYTVVNFHEKIPDRRRSKSNSGVPTRDVNARIRQILEVTIDKLDWIVNGGLKRAGKPERIREVKEALRILRDVGRHTLTLDAPKSPRQKGKTRPGDKTKGKKKSCQTTE